MNTSGEWRVVAVEDWALFRRLATTDGVPKVEIARELGILRTSLIKALASVGPLRYERVLAATSFTPFGVRVRQLLSETPDMPDKVVAERVDWTGSISGYATT